MDGWLWRAASEVVPLSTAMPAGCDGGGVRLFYVFLGQICSLVVW